MMPEDWTIHRLEMENQLLEVKIKNLVFEKDDMQKSLGLAYYRSEVEDNNTRIESLRQQKKNQRFAGLRKWLTLD